MYRIDKGRAVPVSASQVHTEIKRICPICSVSISEASDPSTWRIDFHEDATEEQRIKATKLLLSIKVEDLTPGKQPARKMY